MSGETFRANAPAIVDKILWDKVQTRKTTAVERKQAQNRSIKHFYLLTEFLVCGECGSRYRGRTAPSQHARHYFCSWKDADYKKRPQDAGTWKRGRGCTNTKSLNIPKTDSLVWEAIVKVIKGARLMHDIRGQADGQGTSTALKKQQARLKKTKQDLHRLRETLGNSEANAISGDISDATAGHLRTDLRKRIAKAEIELAACETDIALVKREKKQADWMRHFDTSMLRAESLSDEKKKQVLQQVIDRIVVLYDPKAEAHRLDVHFFESVSPDALRSRESDYEDHLVKAGTTVIALPMGSKKNVPARVNRTKASRPKPFITK